MATHDLNPCFVYRARTSRDLVYICTHDGTSRRVIRAQPSSVSGLLRPVAAHTSLPRTLMSPSEPYFLARLCKPVWAACPPRRPSSTWHPLRSRRAHLRSSAASVCVFLHPSTWSIPSHGPHTHTHTNHSCMLRIYEKKKHKKDS
jgi:hypothetical protein